MPKSIQVFETSDGELFRDPGEAKAHERSLAFLDWYSNGSAENKVYGDECTIRGIEVQEWLLTHKHRVLKLYGLDDEEWEE